MNIFSELRRRMDEAATRNAMRHLDNHLLRDIGLPEREQGQHRASAWSVR